MTDDQTPAEEPTPPTEAFEPAPEAEEPEAEEPKAEEPEAEEPEAEEPKAEEPKAEEHEAPEPMPEEAAELLRRLESELGDAIVESGHTHGDLVVRVANAQWRRAAEVARDQLACDYLSFVSGLDWSPAPRPGGDDEAGGDTSSPVQPTEMTFGVAGSAGRFQLLARVSSTSRRHGITFKTDLDEADLEAPSWVEVYPGADWHERECWEMFGVTFDGHPGLRHLYLPAEFEGHPLRKDFPLLSREVKPWPGLVDVEPMPSDDAGGESPTEEEGE